jgi:hypothetical protein
MASRNGHDAHPCDPAPVAYAPLSVYVFQWRPAHAKRIECSVVTRIHAPGPREAEGFLREDVCQGQPILITRRAVHQEGGPA